MEKCLVTIFYFYGNEVLVCDSLCAVVCSFSHSYLHMDPVLDQFFFCITEYSEFFLGLANGDRECGFCCLFFPSPTMKDLTLFSQTETAFYRFVFSV